MEKKLKVSKKKLELFKKEEFPRIKNPLEEVFRDVFDDEDIELTESTTSDEGSITWTLIDDDPSNDEAALSVNTINSYISVLSTIYANSVITEPSALSDYGLDDPEYTVTFELNDGSVKTIYFGNTTYDSGNCYFMVEGESNVYTCLTIKRIYAAYNYIDFLSSQLVNIAFDNREDIKSYNLDDSFEKGILKTTPFETRPEPTPYEKKELEKEKEHLQKAIDFCVEQSKKRYEGRKESIDDYIGRDRNFDAQEYLDDMESNIKQSQWLDASNNPYVMAINTKKYNKIYIGKSGNIGDDIYDWRESTMSYLYYNRNVLISNKDIGISLIRDIHRNLRVFKG
mgnify:CR=1 FL=1